MWRELADDTRRVLLRAQNLVDESGYPMVTTIHLLVAMGEVQGCVAERILHNFAPGYENAQIPLTQTEEFETYSAGRKMTETAERAVKTAIQIGSLSNEDRASTGSLFLALLEDENSSAGNFLLNELDIDPVEIRDFLHQTTARGPGEEAPHGEFSEEMSHLLALIAHPSAALDFVFKSHGMTAETAIAAYRAARKAPENE